MNEVTCSTCRFWIPSPVMGVCRRYPQVANKHERDWCGEHQASVVRMVPVKDIMTPEEPQRKKPGRKPKHDVSDSAAA